MHNRPPPFTLEIDLHGETLIYREADRKATVICTFGNYPCIVPRTLSGWWYPTDHREVPMSADDGEKLIERIANHCRSHFGMSELRIEGQ